MNTNGKARTIAYNHGTEGPQMKRTQNRCRDQLNYEQQRLYEVMAVPVVRFELSEIDGMYIYTQPEMFIPQNLQTSIREILTDALHLHPQNASNRPRTLIDPLEFVLNVEDPKFTSLNSMIHPLISSASKIELANFITEGLKRTNIFEPVHTSLHYKLRAKIGLILCIYMGPMGVGEILKKLSKVAQMVYSAYRVEKPAKPIKLPETGENNFMDDKDTFITSISMKKVSIFPLKRPKCQIQ